MLDLELAVERDKLLSAETPLELFRAQGAIRALTSVIEDGLQTIIDIEVIDEKEEGEEDDEDVDE